MTGDASNDWAARSASAILAAELGPGAIRASAESDAYLAQANRFVHGFVTRQGGELDFEITVEDAARHKMIESRDYRGPIVSAMTSAAKTIDAGARDFSTSREDAVTAWGKGDYENAVAIDPGFSAAWLDWVQSLAARRETSAAVSIADRALMQQLRSPLDRTRIELARAELRQDQSARIAALAEISKSTNDPQIMAALAEAEVNARQFREAIAQFERALGEDPENARILLSLGYAQAYAGDLDRARQTFERYARQPGQKTNSLDSLGEAYFMNGRFTDAEKYFQAAYQSNPAFLDGVDLLKAAYAHWLAGDLKGADEIAAKFSATQRSAALQSAWWYFATGRRDEAIAKLQQLPDKALIERQTAAWNAPLPDDLAALKTQYNRTPTASDSEIRTFYAAALLKAGQREEARKLISRWPLPIEQGGNALAASRVWPVYLELRQGLH